MNHLIYVLDGRHYRWCGWFGAQLESLEWRRPPAGTERHLLGKTFRVFRTERQGLRCRVAWRWIDVDRGDIDRQNATIISLRNELRAL